LQLNFAFAQNAISLNQAIEIGLKNNYSIQLANNNQSIASANKESARANLLPKLDASASVNKSGVDTRQVFVTGVTQEKNNAKSSQQNAGLQLSWVLFDGLKMFASYDRFQELEKMKIQDGSIDHVSHSAIDSLRTQVRIEAIKAAKAKSDYLLSAIGQKTGKALIVSELENNTLTRSDLARMPARAANKMFSDGAFESIDFEPEIEFQKIKLSYSIYTKFTIQ
jgi:hypothetical protein